LSLRVVAYDEFVRAGSMKQAKQPGTVEGKSYGVKDGDIMQILASGDGRPD
jgi:ribosome-binding ATPase YchF (GTP1/OBG family)